jgi:hypothetical protein
LSAARFGVYLATAGGNRQRALDLYEWTAVASAVFHRDIAHLEVGLRNAYDRAIVTRTPAGVPHWTTDPYRLFPVRWCAARDGTRIDANRTPRQQIERAVREAGPGAQPGKVIAELTFGFWRYLSTAAHHDGLWISYLHTAFTSGTSRRAVDRPVGRLHQLRNRIAHHEPLLRRNRGSGVLSLATQHLVDRHADLLTVAELINPELRDYIAVTSTVRDQLDRLPRFPERPSSLTDNETLPSQQ